MAKRKPTPPNNDATKSPESAVGFEPEKTESTPAADELFKADSDTTTKTDYQTDDYSEGVDHIESDADGFNDESGFAAGSTSESPGQHSGELITDPASEPDQPPAAEKRPPFRTEVEKPICPIHFVGMVKSSSGKTPEAGEDRVAYWRCKVDDCTHKDATVENGLALNDPVYCPRLSCRETKQAMQIDLEKTKLDSGQRLFFVCPHCGYTEFRKGRATRAAEIKLRDIYNR